MRFVLTKTSQLEVTHFENLTAKISQGNSTVNLDVKSLSREECLVLIEALMRILEPSMELLSNLREVYILPEMQYIDSLKKPDLIEKLGSKNLFIPYDYSHKIKYAKGRAQKSFRGTYEACVAKKKELKCKGYRVSEIVPIGENFN